MKEGLNRVQLIGSMGADPELKFAQSGTAVLRLRMATNERFKNKSGEWSEKTEWHTVVFFSNRAEGLAKHLSKGSTVYVEGRLQTRQWEDKDGNKRSTTEVIGTQLLFLDSKGSGGGQQSGGGYGGGSSAPADDGFGGADDFGDDSIPF